MKAQNILTVWAKRAVPVLALAAMLLPACDKEPDTATGPSEPVYREPYEKTLWFSHNDGDSITLPIVKKFANDTACTKIYLTAKPNCSFTRGPEAINRIRNGVLQPALDVSPKVTGRGDIYIDDAPNQIYYDDSVWYVQNGWRFIHEFQH